MSGSTENRAHGASEKPARRDRGVSLAEAGNMLPLVRRIVADGVNKLRRPDNATVDNGVTWISMGAFALPYGLVLRQLLPAASFSSSAAAVPVGARPAAYMGAYAPTVVACTKAQFQADNCASSVATH